MPACFSTSLAVCRDLIFYDDVQSYYAVVLVLGLVFGLLGSVVTLAQLMLG